MSIREARRRSPRAAFTTRAWQVQGGLVGIATATAAYGFAFGVLARTAGLDWTTVLAMSALTFAGGAQAAFVATLLTGTPTAALISAVLVNLRLGVYGAIANQYLVAYSRTRRLVAVHIATDENIALASAVEPASKAGVYLTSGLVVFVVWVASTTIGAVVGDAYVDPKRLGLDVAFPAVFVAMIVPMMDSRRTRLAAATAMITTLAAGPFLAPGIPILAGTAAGVTAVMLLTNVSSR